MAADDDPLNVYLVENSSIMAPFLSGLLDADPGVRVVGQAGDAPTAIRDIERLHPDVAIVDVALDLGSGFDVVKHFRNGGVGAPIWVILSNLASAPYREAARRLGVGLYLDKSTDIRAMLRLVHRLAMNKRSRR